MANLPPLQSNNPTSFHAVALNIVYVAILTVCHFVIPYIHELVFSFFNGLFLILSVILFFYINAALRTSSVTIFSYFSLFFRIISSVVLLSLSIVFIAFITNTTEIIQRPEFVTFLFYLFSFSVLAMVLVKYIYSLMKPTDQPNIILLTDQSEEINIETTYFIQLS